MRTIHEPSERIEATLIAYLGRDESRSVESADDLADAIRNRLVRVTIMARTLATHETDERHATYDETRLVDEWYDAASDSESAAEFAARVWSEAQAALDAL